jgi:Spy/CpxP family protein refolding chaperone
MGKMPHLTKQVMMNWDELELSKDQKEKLTKIRIETMSAVKTLTPQIATLENEVAKATMSGEKPENLKEKVDQIAKLKAKATMAHIKCIHDTKRVLTDRQLEVLK